MPVIGLLWRFSSGTSDSESEKFAVLGTQFKLSFENSTSLRIAHPPQASCRMDHGPGFLDCQMVLALIKIFQV